MAQADSRASSLGTGAERPVTEPEKERAVRRARLLLGRGGPVPLLLSAAPVGSLVETSSLDGTKGRKERDEYRLPEHHARVAGLEGK